MVPWRRQIWQFERKSSLSSCCHLRLMLPLGACVNFLATFGPMWCGISIVFVCFRSRLFLCSLNPPVAVWHPSRFVYFSFSLLDTSHELFLFWTKAQEVHNPGFFGLRVKGRMCVCGKPEDISPLMLIFRFTLESKRKKVFYCYKIFKCHHHNHWAFAGFKSCPWKFKNQWFKQLPQQVSSKSIF